MAKNVKARKDKKGRALLKGESQRASDGMYIYAYTDPFGKRRYLYSMNLVELREKKNKLLKDQMDGLNIYAEGNGTLNMAFDRYMSTKYNLRPTTRSNYNYMYNQFVRDIFGFKKLSDIKYSDVKFFYYYLLNEKGLQINTLDSIHTLLHPTFSMAVRDDVIRKNPTDGVMAEIKKSGWKNKGIRHALTVEQQRAFMRYCEESPEYSHWLPLFTVLLGTGCRVGEVIGLRWKDVNLKERTISVNHSVSYYVRDGHSGFGVSLPKTEAGVRTVPMMDRVHDVLAEEYKRQKVYGFCTYELEGLSGFIFFNRNGVLHNPHCINKAIERVYSCYNVKEVLDAKKEHREPVIIPHFSCHHMRHTFCSRLCENETNVKVIQDVMGHANIETTLDIYAEVNYSKKKEAIENLSHSLDVF